MLTKNNEKPDGKDVRFLSLRAEDDISMKHKRKIVFILMAILVAVAGCIVTPIGLWPESKSGFEDKSYYIDAIAAIEQRRPQSFNDSNVGQFEAGWAARSITPPVGTPLAGYGDRMGKPSTGVLDEIFVKALAVSDGVDTAIIVGADMLIIPENVADMVRIRVSQQSPLTANEILFNASHNHCGPGGFAPGIASWIFNGPYNPKIPEFLSRAFTEAIVEAYQSLEPAKVAYGGLDVPEHIRNRTRKGGPVDSELSYMLVEQKDSDRCIVVSYSAHPTIIDSDNMQFTGEYPGFLMRRITEKTGAAAIYLGGSVGSMSCRAPEGADSFERCRKMGKALADNLLDAIAEAPNFEDKVDVASIGIPIQLPPFQLRLSEHFRLSRFMFPILGIDNDGWMHAVRIGDIALVGTPADYCGEISADLKIRMKNRLGDLWVLSFNGDYVGYISPDKYYYDKDEKGGYGYERGLMSWIGPEQEAFTVSLITNMIDALFPRSSSLYIAH